MNKEDIEKIATAVADGLQPFVEAGCAAVDKMTAGAAKQPEKKSETEVSKAVSGWINNTPENQPEPEEISAAANSFIKENGAPQGKSLGLKEDPGPTMVHGVLTGKTV